MRLVWYKVEKFPFRLWFVKSYRFTNFRILKMEPQEGKKRKKKQLNLRSFFTKSKIKELGAIKQKKYILCTTSILLSSILMSKQHISITVTFGPIFNSHYHYPHVPLPSSCSCFLLYFPLRIKNMILTNASFLKSFKQKMFLHHN